MKGHSVTPGGMWIKHTRWALLKAPEKLTDRQRSALAAIQHTNQRLYRAYLLKEQLRALYQLEDAAHAPEHLHAWIAWAVRSRLKSGRGQACPGPSHTTRHAGPHRAVRSTFPDTTVGNGEPFQADCLVPVGVRQGGLEWPGPGDAPVTLL
jgi:Transposase